MNGAIPPASLIILHGVDRDILVFTFSSFFTIELNVQCSEDNSKSLTQYSCGSQPPGTALLPQETERSVGELMTRF